MKISIIKQPVKIWLLALLFSGVANLQAADIPIIAAASSVKFALQEISAAFKQDTGNTVRFSFASSGNLTRQIQQGAPFELFLSANTYYVEQLQRQKLSQDHYVVYALGRLVLMTTDNSQLQLDDKFQHIKQAIKTGRLHRFAIANPKHAPYGVAAREVLQHLNLWNEILPHLVLGENAAQAAQFAGSGAAQAGLTSYSLALSAALNNKITSVLIPQDYHQPLTQTMVLLNNAGNTSKQFYRYLQQDKAADILSQYGYTRPSGM